MNLPSNFNYLFFLSFLLFLGATSNAQTTRNVLFLGNSYTGTNNLPQIIYDVALSAGDTLTFDSYTPGGFHLINHSTSSISQSKIMTGGWDYVVLQGQSREPLISGLDFKNGINQLNSQITQYDPCALPMFYMTWGRKNGDPTYCDDFPTVCTYEGMDSSLRNQYLAKTASLYAEVSPVSVVWNHIRQNYPNIELYQTDGSHPSLAGSYAAACCFYTSIFKKNPQLIADNYGLNPTDAANIRNATKIEVFDQLSLWDYKQLPTSSFFYSRSSGAREISFKGGNRNTESYLWDFGDGNTSTLPLVTNTYLSDGTYTVSLTTTNCDPQGLHTSITDTIIQFCSHTPTIINTSDSVVCKHDTLWTPTADSYQWLSGGFSLPETGPYISDYNQYMFSNFSVISTVNGCSELSEEFIALPEWSGYYFDAALGGGIDPCIGDTVILTVKHFNGLSGSEMIQWYRNDILLSSFTDEDSLLIMEGGTYECDVINLNATCPMDTTSALVTYDCVTTIFTNSPNLFEKVFPNPSYEEIVLTFIQEIREDQIQFYNTIGRLIKEIKIVSSQTTKVNISDLPKGIYFIRLKNNKSSALKIIKH